MISKPKTVKIIDNNNKPTLKVPTAIFSGFFASIQERSIPSQMRSGSSDARVDRHGGTLRQGKTESPLIKYFYFVKQQLHESNFGECEAHYQNTEVFGQPLLSILLNSLFQKDGITNYTIFLKVISKMFMTLILGRDSLQLVSSHRRVQHLGHDGGSRTHQPPDHPNHHSRKL